MGFPPLAIGNTVLLRDQDLIKINKDFQQYFRITSILIKMINNKISIKTVILKRL